MRHDDMIMVSIDDHVIEPPHIFEEHAPASLRDQMPQFVRSPEGIDTWVFQGEVMGTSGLGAVASWPHDEWGFDPVGHAEMRPGCYDVHERVRDMNANGVLASMNFPTSAGFAGAWLAGKPDRKLAAQAVSAYNDWHIDDWCGSYPGRFIPLAVLPLWDVDACVAEIDRVAAKGCTAVTFPETPHANDLPGFYGDHWDPVFAALSDNDVAMCMHIGGAFGLIRQPEGATADQLIVLAPQLSAIATTDLMVSGTFNRFPKLKVALSEGGIGWIPFLLDRMDRHLVNQSWTGLDLGGKTATELWQSNFIGCFITDPTALHVAERIGIDTLTWECDYPHSDSTWPQSPEFLSAEFEAAGLDDRAIEKITWENASRFFRFDPFAHIPRESANVASLRALATDVDTRTTSRQEYRDRYQSAGR